MFETTFSSLPKMSEHFYLILFFFLYTRGTVVTECDSFEGTKLRCIFSPNINLTKTNFTVFFYSEGGPKELLADCGWVGDKLHCLTHEGSEFKQPVSETVEISVPTQFVSKPGTYRCIADSTGNGSIKPCRFNRQKNRTEEFRESLNETSSNSKEENRNGKIVGGVLGAVAFVIFVVGLVIVAACRKCYSKKRQEETESELSTVTEREELRLTPVT